MNANNTITIKHWSEMAPIVTSTDHVNGEFLVVAKTNGHSITISKKNHIESKSKHDSHREAAATLARQLGYRGKLTGVFTLDGSIAWTPASGAIQATA